MPSLSKIKIVQNKQSYEINDKNAVKKIIFNGLTYIPNSKGEINFTDNFMTELESANILKKRVINYNDEADVYNNELYIVKETDSKKYSNYSTFIYDEGNLIQLTTPSLKFESDDVDFFTLLNLTEYPKYLTWDLLYNANIFNTSKKLYGKDVFGNTLNGTEKKVYYCLKDYDEDTYELAPYIVYKQTVNNVNYLVKQYIKLSRPDGGLELIEGKATKCSTTNNIKERNGFARNVEKA